MQRHNETIIDGFGNPWTGATLYVYLTGTTAEAALFAASDTTDTATTVLTQPLLTSSNGRLAFAVADGDYDLVYTYPDGSTQTKRRINFFDSSTATTIPVSSISLTMPTQLAVTGSPGTTLGVDWNTTTANYALLGPTTGAAAKPTLRAFVAADISSIACLLTTPQTVAGNKTFSDPAIFSSTVAVTGAATFASTVGVTGKATFDAGIDLSKGTAFDIDGTTGYDSAMGQFTSVTTGAIVSALVTGNIYAPAFPDAAVTVVCGSLSLPFGYEAGTDFIPFVMWMPNGTNTGTCRWELEYSGIKGYDQGVFPAATTITVDKAASTGTALRLYTTPFSAITGTAYEVGSSLIFRLSRNGTHGNDTLTQTAFVVGFGIYYKKSRFSTKNTTPPFYT